MDSHSLLGSGSSFDLNLLITALDTVSDGLLIVDTNYRILYKNVAANYLLGGINDRFEFAEWRHLYKIHDLKSRKELDVPEMPIYRAVNGLKFTDYRVYIATKNNQEGFYISCNGTPLIGDDNRIVGGVLTFRNITSSYLSERILSQERAFYKNILDLIPGLVFVRDEFGSFYFTNQEFDDLWKKYSFLIDRNEELIQQIREHDEEVKRELKAKEFDEVMKWVNGEERFFKTIRFPIYHQATNKVLICGIGFDVTERKQIETKLAEERLKSINASKLAAIGTLAGEIGHEINNPIAIIKSVTFLLREMIEDHSIDEDVLKQKIDSIDTVLERITSIIRSLKNLSRKGLNETKEACTIRTILADVLPLVQLKMKKNGIDLLCDLNGPAFNEQVVCYHVQLGEVLMNLLTNSADATESVSDPWVKIEASSDARHIYIRIRDNGTGVPKDICEKIFEPFFTTKDIGKGTGLGLSISKNILKAHEGDLTLEPTAIGASFVVKIPKSSMS